MDDIDFLWQTLGPRQETAAIVAAIDVLQCVREQTPGIEFLTYPEEALQTQLQELDQRTGIVSACTIEVVGEATQLKFEIIPACPAWCRPPGSPADTQFRLRSLARWGPLPQRRRP